MLHEGTRFGGTPHGWRWKEGTDERPTVTRNTKNGQGLDEVLEYLETRLEAYLVEWRQQLGIQERPEACSGRKKQSLDPPSGRKGDDR
jgi:hypothetical protein